MCSRKKRQKGWGGTEGYLLISLQVQLNRAARLVTGLSCFTSTKKLMDTCGWLTVKQRVMYQTTIIVHKTFMTNKPYYLHSRLDTEPGSTLVGASGLNRLSSTLVIYQRTSSGAEVHNITTPYQQTSGLTGI